MQIETFVETDYENAEALLADIAKRLSFPAHFGGNFAALSDCLGDISETVVIVCDRCGDARPFFDTFQRVCERVAEENPSLVVRSLSNDEPQRPHMCMRDYIDGQTSEE